MIQFKTEVETNFAVKAKAEADPQALLEIVSIVVKATTREIVLPLAKSAKSAVRTTISSQSVKAVVQTNVILVEKDPNSKGKERNFMR